MKSKSSSHRPCSHFVKYASFTIVLVVLCAGCEGSDTCEDGFVQQYGPDGSTFCIPEFEEGLLNDFKLGSSYFHDYHGLITLEHGIWKNQKNQVILP